MEFIDRIVEVTLGLSLILQIFYQKLLFQKVTAMIVKRIMVILIYVYNVFIVKNGNVINVFNK